MTPQPPINWAAISRRLYENSSTIRPNLLRKKHVTKMDSVMNDLAEWWKVRRAELLGEHDPLPDKLETPVHVPDRQAGNHPARTNMA